MQNTINPPLTSASPAASPTSAHGTPFDVLTQPVVTQPIVFTDDPTNEPEWLKDIISAKKSVREYLRTKSKPATRFLGCQHERCVKVQDDVIHWICTKLDYMTGADVVIDELMEERVKLAQHTSEIMQQLAEQREIAETEVLNRQDLERVILQFERETQQSLDLRDKAIVALRQNINDLIQDKLHLMAQVGHLRRICETSGESLTEFDSYEMNHGSQNPLSPDYAQPSQTISPLPRQNQQSLQENDNQQQTPTSQLVYITTICPPLEED